MQLSKDGGAFAQKSAAGNATHDTDGWYSTSLSTTDTGTLGILVMQVAVSGALPVWVEFMVMPANVYDSFFSTDNLQVDVTQWLGTAAATPTVAGVPEVDVTHVSGTAEDIFQGDDEANLVDLVWDEVLTGGTHNVVNSAGRRLRALQEQGGYDMGAIWIDTVNGTAGTTSFENGTSTNPVDTLADALTLSTNLGIKRFVVLAGSSITLTGAATNYELIGQNWTLAFGGQSIAGSQIVGATVSGTYTGTTAILEDCIINAITGPGITMRRCFFNEVTITNNGTAGWYLNDCRSRVAGTGRATFDFGAAVGNTGLSLRNFSGGIELHNLGQVGTDNASIEGFGNLVLNANCVGGTVARRGVWDFTDNSTGVTFAYDELRDDVKALTSGGTDWTTSEKEEIRGRLGITGTTSAGGNTPTLATQASVDTVDANVDSILVDTGTTIPAQISGLNDISAGDILTTALSESYAADGAAPTLSQAVLAIQQFLQERSVNSSTVTVKQLDGSTTAMTFTMDSDTAPTSITRST